MPAAFALFAGLLATAPTAEAAPPAEDVAAMLEEAHRERARMLQQIGDAMGGL